MRRLRFYLALCLALGACSQRGCNEKESAPGTAAPAKNGVAGNPALPGLGQADPQLVKRLHAALLEKPAGYEPRTHHKLPNGEPKYINRLILETSPYLLQHAHNPVNWYPWSDEAFERARREGKPVLLSIGYSTCHWCHVMERESFEDLEIAEFINRHYVAIKVDREERPDLDDIYMSAVQSLSGRGGWPMTVMLTPDREPFFGGTYFPPRDGARGAQKGFLSILKELAKEYETRGGELVKRAKELSHRIREASRSGPAGAVPNGVAIDETVRRFARSFDPEWGGFGRAPKFPRPVALELLLRYHRRTKDPQALHIVLKTLTKMAEGGLYDQVGGGFHRYSTDARWLVPHFEKMLYDNAQLVSVYLSAYQLSNDAAYARVARETLRYVEREMTDGEGAFYSATDADSKAPSGHDEEGYFFTWTEREIESVLGRERGRVFSRCFGVTSRGNFEGRNILYRPRSLAELARELAVGKEELEASLAADRSKLYDARMKRPKPLRDDKILTANNGLMISAFAQAALVLGEPRFEARASRAANFLLEKLRDSDGKLLRSYRDGRARHIGYLRDYAFVIQGFLDLYEATSSLRWLEQSMRLQSILDRDYLDPAGGYFMTSSKAEKLLTRSKPTYDGAEPSGNSVALLNLLRFADITGKREYRERAEKGFAQFATDLTRGGQASPKMLSALDHLLDRTLEVVIVKPAGADAEPLLESFRKVYLPNRVLAIFDEGTELERSVRLVPLLEGKRALAGKPTAFVCEQGHCDLPTFQPRVFGRQLRSVTPLLDVSVRASLPAATPRPRIAP